jgi:CheY-specific phosphatase CheX
MAATDTTGSVTITLDKRTAQEIAVTLWGITSLIDDDTDPTVQRLRNAMFVLADAACELPADYFASLERMS